ncbi:MAG: hypothetical protein Q8M98_07850 [Candidatus Cloacimonadaceae bacterium]|nr:hypothetical protein [Candidatus Cloacimonadaceae bacterium]
MRIEFCDRYGSVEHEIGESSIVSYKQSGKKLISEDYFMNEPASIEVTIISDVWLLERWEQSIVKISSTLWFSKSVRVYGKNSLSGYAELKLSGLLQLTGSGHDPFAHTMQLQFYDFSALLSELDIPVRIYYPYSLPDGTDWTRFIVNYQLPGSSGAPAGGPDWYPYPSVIETTDRQVSSVLRALTQIFGEIYQGNWALDFNHEYEVEEAELTWVNNYIVQLADADTFFQEFVSGLVTTAYNNLMNLGAVSGWQFWANYGFVPPGGQSSIYDEYGLWLPGEESDGWFVMRAGYQWMIGGKDDAIPDGGWTDGEGGGGGGGGGGTWWYREWYRIFRLKAGRSVWDSGVRTRLKQGRNSGSHIGGLPLNTSNYLSLSENSFYRCSANELYAIPPAYQNDIMGYFYSLSYYVYFTGLMEGSGGYIGNRIFRMKNNPQGTGQEQYVEQKLREWFKTMLFVGDLSCYADETGVIKLAPRSPLGNINLPLAALSKLQKKLLVYQPWDKEKIEEVINDRTEVQYLIDHYGGGRVLTHELELRFGLHGFTTIPLLRQRFVLPAQIWGVTAFSGAQAYMIVEVEFEGEYELVIRAVRV